MTTPDEKQMMNDALNEKQMAALRERASIADYQRRYREVMRKSEKKIKENTILDDQDYFKQAAELEKEGNNPSADEDKRIRAILKSYAEKHCNGLGIAGQEFEFYLIRPRSYYTVAVKTQQRDLLVISESDEISHFLPRLPRRLA